MEQLTLRGTLKGHNGWVTQIATTPQDPNQILSSSRDKTLILWDLTRDDEMNYGTPKRSLTGHNHFVSDVVMSSDGQFALSGSWDKTLRLWDLTTGVTTRQFVGPQRMYSVLHSLLITDKSFLDHVTTRSSCGIPLVSANTPSTTSVIPNGFHVFDSLLIHRTQS